MWSAEEIRRAVFDEFLAIRGVFLGGRAVLREKDGVAVRGQPREFHPKLWLAATDP
jgi:hypothetical protein